MEPEESDIAQAFGANIELERPDDGDTGFFLVERKPEVDHNVFLGWLVSVIGGSDRLLFQHSDGLYVVWISFHVSEAIKSHQAVELVGPVGVDVERLQMMLQPEV